MTTHSPGLRSTNSKRIGTPGFALFAMASFAATNSIVIFGQFSDATGSCVMVSAPVFASTSSTRPSALCATVLAPAAFVLAAAVKPPSAAFRLLSASIRKFARVTTWSPSLSPDSASTKPSPRTPSFTSRGSKRPSPSATSTTCRLPLLITAESGTASTSRFAPASICTVPYIPGFSCPCGLASSKRTRAVRVSVFRVG